MYLHKWHQLRVHNTVCKRWQNSCAWARLEGHVMQAVPHYTASTPLFWCATDKRQKLKYLIHAHMLDLKVMHIAWYKCLLVQIKDYQLFKKGKFHCQSPKHVLLAFAQWLWVYSVEYLRYNSSLSNDHHWPLLLSNFECHSFLMQWLGIPFKQISSPLSFFISVTLYSVV